jgi:hypothetical protein
MRFWSYLAQFFSEWKIFRTNFVEKIKTPILYLRTFFFRKLYCLYDTVETYFRAAHATDDNVARAHCVLDIESYTRSKYVILILRILLRVVVDGDFVINIFVLICHLAGNKSLFVVCEKLLYNFLLLLWSNSRVQTWKSSWCCLLPRCNIKDISACWRFIYKCLVWIS